MKQMQKQFWSLLLCVAMVLAMLPATAAYAEAVTLTAPVIELASDEIGGGLSYSIAPVESETAYIAGYLIQLYDADGNEPVGGPVSVSGTSGNIPISDGIQGGTDYTAKAAAVARADSGRNNSGYGSLCQPATAVRLLALTAPGITLLPSTAEGGIAFSISPVAEEAEFIEGYLIQAYDVSGEYSLGAQFPVSGTTGRIPLSDSIRAGMVYTVKAAAIAKAGIGYENSGYGSLSQPVMAVAAPNTALTAPDINLFPNPADGGLTFLIMPVPGEMGIAIGFSIQLYDATGEQPVGEPISSFGSTSGMAGRIPLSGSIRGGTVYTAKAAAVARPGIGYVNSGYGSLSQPVMAVAALNTALTAPGITLSPNPADGGLSFAITPAASEAAAIESYRIQLYDANGDTAVGEPISSASASGSIALSEQVLADVSYTARAEALANESSNYVDSGLGALSETATAAPKKQTPVPKAALTAPGITLSPNPAEGGLSFAITPVASEAAAVESYRIQLYDAKGETAAGEPISSASATGSIALSEQVLADVSYKARAEALAKESSNYADSGLGALSETATAAPKKQKQTPEIHLSVSQDVYFRIQVTYPSAITGTITIYKDSDALHSFSPNSSGITEISKSFIRETHKYKAVYSGDASYNSADSNEVTFSAGSASSDSVTSSGSGNSNSIVQGALITTTASASGTTMIQAPAPGGTLSPGTFSGILTALSAHPAAGIMVQNTEGSSLQLTGEQVNSLLSSNVSSLGLSIGFGSVVLSGALLPPATPFYVSLTQTFAPPPPPPPPPPGYPGVIPSSAVSSGTLLASAAAPLRSLGYRSSLNASGQWGTGGGARTAVFTLSAGTDGADTARDAVKEAAYKLTVKAGDTEWKTLKEPADLRLLYSLPSGADASALAAYYVADNGQRILTSSYYDAGTGTMMIRSKQCGIYVISYQPVQFQDVAQHEWYRDAVSFLSARSLMTGTGDAEFKPGAALSRGMLLTVLGRLAGVDASAYKTSSFTDVKAGSVFQPYIEWAYKNSIVQGVGNSLFIPDRAVTREETALILQRYAKATGFVPPAAREAVAFADNQTIGSVFQEAAAAMQTAGIMSVKSNGNFNPNEDVTRGELAVILHRYVKLAIDPSTAQGWAVDDDGQRMYYKGKKALTGWQEIEGEWYFFSADGSLAGNINADGLPQG